MTLSNYECVTIHIFAVQELMKITS